MVADPARKKLSSVPFPAIVGQDDLKRVLLLAAAHDDLSGAVITGEKGTAKSTAVRGLVDLLPKQQAVADCPYGCDPDDPASQCAKCRDREADALPVETRQVPLVTLPLGATRDRVVGTLSVEDAMAGDAEFDPGLLAAANRGILYVDEINLLDDHLVDVLLDAAASGVNTVERDGISVSHPAEFTLIGTMNPEEGDLRPQLRDRFDLQATVTGCQDTDDRVDIIDRALDAGDGNGDSAADDSDEATEYGDRVADLRESLRAARESIESVSLPAEFKQSIAELCADAGVDGHRADIATARAAIASAALDGRPKVIESDVQEAARYTLPHRLQSQPFEEPPDPEELLDDHFDDADDENGDSNDAGDDASDEGSDAEEEQADDESEEGDDDESAANEGDDPGESDGSEKPDGGDSDAGTESEGERDTDGDPDDDAETDGQAPTGGDGDHDGSQRDAPLGEASDDADEPAPEADDEEAGTPLVPGEQRASVGDAAAPDIDEAVANGDIDTESDTPGQRAGRQQAGGRGTRVRTEPANYGDSIDAAASVRTAASRGHERVEAADLRQPVRERDQAATVVFAVDASASMTPAMEAAKGVVLELLRDAYEQRDEVAFVAFGGDDAEVLLPPTRSVSLAARHLKSLPTGDRTPLPAGLSTAATVRDNADTPLGVVVLITDGRATVADGSPTAATRRAAEQLAGPDTTVVVVAAGESDRGLIPTIVEVTGAETVPLAELSPQVVANAVHRAHHESRSESSAADR